MIFNRKEMYGSFDKNRYPNYPGIGTMIGSKMDYISPKFKRLAKLDSCDNKRIREYRFYREIREFLYKLDIKLNRFELHKESQRFYNFLPYNTKFRNKKYIVPVVIYIECLNHFIYINRNTLQESVEYPLHKFFKCLHEYYKFRRDVYLKHLSREFRIKYISMILSGLKQQFNFPPKFLTYAINILKEFYSDLSNKKNTLIAGLIFAAINKRFSLVQYNQMRNSINWVCKWLGITESVLLKLNHIVERLI